jgi:hypothetical protein
MKSQSMSPIRKTGFIQRVVNFFKGNKKSHDKAPTNKLNTSTKKKRFKWPRNKLSRKWLRRQVFGGAAERMLYRTNTKRHAKTISKKAV